MSEYPACQFCGAEKVLNPKTGKIFCKAKCWLNKKPTSTPSFAGPNLQAIMTELLEIKAIVVDIRNAKK